MYESFYGLKEKPFSLLPDPDYLYLSPKHQRALTLLEYGMMNQAGFSVICGDTGAGKTTLIRRLLNELGNDTTVGLITNTHQSFGELLNWVLMAFGLDGEGKSKAQMHQIFLEFLIEQYARNQHTILIVDEAQNMSPDTLEELRMLSNINADKDQVLQVILAGQPALRETLRRPELMQFAQRIAVDYYLEALDKAETREYILHRLEIAGSDREIFTPEACEAIYKFSGGVPRLINLLCDTAMVYGYADQAEVIGPKIIHDVVREQHANSIVPTFNRQEFEQSVSATGERQQGTTEQIHIDKLSERLHPAESPVQKDQVPEQPAESVQPHSEPQETSEEVALPDETLHARNPEPEKPEQYSAGHESSDASQFSQAQESVTEFEPEQPRAADTNADQYHHEQHYHPGADNDDAAVQSDFEETAESFVNQSRDDRYQQHDNDPIYPIIEVKNDARKGLNYLVLGLTMGILMASLVLVMIGYYVFKNQVPSVANQNQVQQESRLQEIQRVKEMEQTRLEAMKRERDAALAISHALERERDAALATAKAQEELRNAEKRAADMVRQQEQKSARQLQEAREKAHQAELAAARAKEKERQATEQVQQAVVEKQKLEELRRQAQQKAAAALAARQQAQQSESRTEAPVMDKATAEVTPSPVQSSIPDPAPETPAKAPIHNEPAAVEKPAQKPVEFSANPCNSPSAKFLSTCKK